MSPLKLIKDVVVMVLGMMVAAAAVYYFLVPGKLIIGSISGLSIVMSAILEGFGIHIKVSMMVIIINAILLILAYFLIGSEFGLKTAFTAMILGPLMELWEKILPYEKLVDPASAVPSVMGDIWFDLLCYVLLVSASQTILFSINASTGGLDILAKIVNKFFHFDIGKSITVAGVMICLTAFFVNPFRLVVIGLIGTWMNGLIVDYFTISLNKKKRVCIITEDYDRVRDFIINHIRRGCSLYEVIGGYTGEKNMEVQSILTQTEFADLMKWLKKEDIKAFITAGSVNEIYGFWLKHTRAK